MSQGLALEIRICLAVLAAMLAAMSLASAADAAKVHPFKGTFGTSAQPSFTTPTNLAVDQSTGDVLVVDRDAQTISRFKSNGEPDPFTALGTNVIDAKKGPGGKACAEEPSSCDETPENGLSPGGTGFSAEFRIAVDDSGGSTDGNIYVTQYVTESHPTRIDVFASDGHYLGQLKEYQSLNSEVQSVTRTSAGGALGGTYKLCKEVGSAECTSGLAPSANGAAVKAALEALYGAGNIVTVTGFGAGARTVTFGGSLANSNVPQMLCDASALTPAGSTCAVVTTINGGFGPVPMGGICGVGVDSAGAVYAADFQKSLVHKFIPSSQLPVVGDGTGSFAGVESPCSVAAGAAASAGSFFVAKGGGGGGGLYKLDSTSGGIANAGNPVVPGIKTNVTVNPADGKILVASGNLVTEYDASGASSALQESTLTAGSAVSGVAVNGATGNVYVSRVGSANLEVFAPPAEAPEVTVQAASGVTGSGATLAGTVNPKGGEIEECKFEYGTTPALGSVAACQGSVPTDSSPHTVTALIGGLQPNGVTYYFRLAAKNAVASIVSEPKRTFITAKTAITGDAEAVGDTSAVLAGVVIQEEGAAFTECMFEYLTASAYIENGNSYSGPNPPSTKPCDPDVGAIEADNQPHAVSATVAGLAKNTTFHFRLAATSGSAVKGEDKVFATQGPPQVAEERAESVESHSATLVAKITPSGLATTYYFEWGTEASYGNRIPLDFDLFAGSGDIPVRVTATLKGLGEHTSYHFRVVAANSSGMAKGHDQKFMTLTSLGLPDNRGAELVSPADKRPSGLVGSIAGENAIQAMASEDGQSFMYPILNGLEGSTAGGNLLEIASRDSSGWLSSQLSPPSLIAAPEIINGEGVNPSGIKTASPDLSCGVVKTFNPLTEDTPSLDVELGITNLYVWHADGSYDLITNRVPLNPGLKVGFNLYRWIATSVDCSRVYFKSDYQLLPGASGLYEWSEGNLRDAGALPDGAIASGEVSEGNSVDGVSFPASLSSSSWNAVTPDGSLFFSATSNAGLDSGKRAIFLRKGGGSSVVDISQSKTAVAPNGARYETATEDGKHVFFRANYGIAAASSSGATNGQCAKIGEVLESLDFERCDLYDYNVETGQLTDLSVDTNPADTSGASVQGVVAVSPDGSHVYFAARGQLVPGRGKTFVENQQGEGSANIYLAQDGELAYVTNLSQTANAGSNGDLLGTTSLGSALMRGYSRWTAATTEKGDQLLFTSVSNSITGYDSGGAPEAYLFIAGPGSSGNVECVSCRPDGLPSVHSPAEGFFPLPVPGGQQTMAGLSRPRAMSEDGRRIFFTSPDVLAPGGISGKRNVYEWEEGNVYLLAVAQKSGGSGAGGYLDSSPSGNDVFLATSEKLAPQDIDFVSDVYDLRVEGGFATKVVPTPCDPANDQCQGPPANPPAAINTPSADFAGQGNPPPSVSKQHKNPHRKHHKKKGHRKGHKARTTHSNRGGAK